MLNGIITAIVTPFKEGNLDLEAFKDLVKWQIAEGVNGIVVSGTTGESPNLSDDEFAELISVAVEISNRRIPIIAGTGTNSTAKTITRTKLAKEMGADAALVVTPYYNKPTQEGIIAHFKAITEACDIDIYLYDAPGRAGIKIADATVVELMKFTQIKGIKDCSGDANRPITLDAAAKKMGKKFAILAGDDDIALPYMLSGGVGCVSVTSNIAPAMLARMCANIAAGKIDDAKAIHEHLLPLHSSMFVETNPGPVKYALSKMGKIHNELRLPLVPVSGKNAEVVSGMLQKLGII